MPPILRLAALLAPVFLAGCQYAQPARLQPVPLDFKVYEQERFSQKPAHARSLAVTADVACQAGRRALLSQGYQLFDNGLTKLVGRKYFRPANGTAVELIMTITCLRNPDDETRSSVYVTSWQDAYVTKRNTVEASAGVSVLGSVSVPVATTDDALVKVGMETITDPEYYGRFFELLESLLPKSKR